MSCTLSAPSRPFRCSPARVRGWRVWVVGWVLLAVMGTWAWAAGLGRIVPDVVALKSLPTTVLPAPPPWDSGGKATLWTIDEIKAEFAKNTDTPPRVNFLRPIFLRPEHGQLVDFKAWFRSLEKPLKIRFVDQLWDCDNYVSCFVAFADLLGLRAGERRGSLCIGWATVNYRYRFAGVRAGTAHAVVVVGTSKGLFIIEPQDGTMVALRDFPNRHTMEEVNF